MCVFRATGSRNGVVMDVYWNMWSLLVKNYEERTYCKLVMQTEKQRKK